MISGYKDMNKEFIDQISKAAGAYAYVKKKKAAISEAEKPLREYKSQRRSEDARIPALEAQIKQTRADIVRQNMKNILIPTILVCIAAGATFLACKGNRIEPMPWWGAVASLVSGLVAIPSMLFFIGTLFVFVSELFELKGKKQKAQEELAVILANKAKESEKIAALEKNIEDACYIAQEAEKLLAPLIEYFPPKYRTDEAVVFLLECAENGRADSLKEALNLYEQHLYMKRQERMIENAIDAASESNAALEAAMRDVEKAQKEVASSQRELRAEIERIDYENKLHRY